MRVLVINCGSSSVKLSVYDQSNQKHTFSCKAERIGTSEAFFTFQDERIEIPEADHHSALQRLEPVLLADEGALYLTHDFLLFVNGFIISEFEKIV